MGEHNFKGIYSAIFSLYDEHMNVKKKSVETLIDFETRNGIKGFYVGGNTGECTVLPNKVRKQMLEAVKEYASPSTEIIAHIGACHLDDTKELIEHSNAVGVDAISSLPPSLTSYYSADEIIEYYTYIASISKSPVLAYVNRVLNCDIMWFVNKIANIDNMMGVKLTIPDYYLFEKIKSSYKDRINVLNGPDECMLAGLSVGADGAIGTSYNLMPATACKIYESFQNQNYDEALKCQQKLNRVIDVLAGKSIAVWKVPLIALGIDIGYTIAPAHIPKIKEVDELLRRLEDTAFAEEIKLGVTGTGFDV